jgi:hypothetical protein
LIHINAFSLDPDSSERRTGAQHVHILLRRTAQLSKAAMKHGIELAKPSRRVTALVVSTPLNSLVVDPSIVSTRWINTRRWCFATADISTIIKNNAVGLASIAVLCIEHDKPYEAIVDTAKNNIVTGGRGIARFARRVGDPRQRNLKVLTHTRSQSGLSLAMVRQAATPAPARRPSPAAAPARPPATAGSPAPARRR